MVHPPSQSPPGQHRHQRLSRGSSQSPASSPSYASQLPQLVQAIERRHLVTLREGGIVEDALHEIVERSAESHHRLADVHELRRLRAECPYAQELSRLEVKDELEHSVQITEDLAARNFLVSCDPGLVRDRLRRELHLVATHPRDLGDRVDAERVELGDTP